MCQNLALGFICLLIAAGASVGCKQKASNTEQSNAQATASPSQTSQYFKTSFQNESEFIVEAIISDLAEEIFYAANHRVPEKSHFLATITEKPDSPRDTPIYEADIRLDPRTALKAEIKIDGPIWSPFVYQNLASELARTVGLSASASGKAAGDMLVSRLTDASPETIAREDEALSEALEKDFSNPGLHEKAAELLGAFLLRDHSGKFFDIRTPLSRITAHLAMARFLRGAQPIGVDGQMAEALMLALVNDSALAVERLDAVPTNDVAVAAVARALRARCTGDYRRLDNVKDRSPIENFEWFYSFANYVSPSLAWPRLSDRQKQTIDFVRAANDLGYSVEIGHQLLETAIPLELREISSVYQLCHQTKLNTNKLVEVLNELPQRCFVSASDGKPHVRVIGWGQWALFLQRHLCHAVQQNFHFMYQSWGVRDNAKEFADDCEQHFSGLRLYPFVRRYNCTDAETYHKAVDDGLTVTIDTPHLSPAECWNYLCYKPSFATTRYLPNPNPHVNEWHNHNPPPGTVYDLYPRLEHPSLTGRPDTVEFFEKLHKLAPWDCRIVNFLLKRKYNDHPTYAQASALYQAVLPYSETALRATAQSVRDKPEEYDKLMTKAAELDPRCYYDLGDYALEHNEEDKASRYIEKACAADPDAVRVSNHAVWRVRYFLKKGDTDKARQIADEAGDVYSFAGLEAKAIFLEWNTNYGGAFKWYARIEERYDNSSTVIDFCLRYKSHSGDTMFDSELDKRIGKLFPKGIEKVAISDFHGPPTDGVLIRQENDLLKAAGLKSGDVIVAVYGVRVHNFQQYTYGRELKNTPELELIAWIGNAYRELKPNPPHHRFGLDFGDFRSK